MIGTSPADLPVSIYTGRPALYMCAIPVRFRQVTEEAAMRAEAQKHVDSIEEALTLLRRHL